MSKRAYTARDLTQSELHSAAELKCVAAVLNVIARGSLKPYDVLTALSRGNNLILSDACADDPLGGILIIEYDEGYWHRDRIQKDIEKSIAQLAHGGVRRLVRLRRGVRAIAEDVKHPGYVEVCTDSQDAKHQAKLIVAALNVEYDDARAERGVELGILAHVELEQRAQANFEFLKQTCGRRAAVHVLEKVSGVKMRIWERSWVDALLRFRDIVGHRYLCTSLSGSVASRLESDAWFQGLQRLSDMVGGPQYLRTSLSDGVASRLESDAWFQGLQRLSDMVGGPQYLRTSLSGSVASRLESEGFCTTVNALVELLGNVQTARLLGRDCIAVRLERVKDSLERTVADERALTSTRMYRAASRGARQLEALLVH